MGKAKEIAELGDKITVSGGTVTVADISTSTFSGTSIHSMQDVDLTGIAHNMFLKYNLSNTQFEVVAGNTSSIDEGTNLYYTDARVASYLSSNDFDTATNIVASITDSAPGTLDTLNELAAALGDDANFSTTVTNSIATKLPLAGGTITGNLEINTGTNKNIDITALSHQTVSDMGVGLTFSRTTSDAPLMSVGVVEASQLGLMSRSGIKFLVGGTNNYQYTSEAMTINGSGNVGIGTTSIAANTKLIVKAATNQNFEVEYTSGKLRLAALNDARSANVPLQFTSTSFEFLSGNLLVGKASSDTAVDGTTVFSSGYLATTVTQGTANSGAVAQFRRNSTDGNIVNFLKNSSTVGSIGVRSNGLRIDKGNTKLVVYDDGTTNSFFPESSGDDVDLGLSNSGFAWRNLYLSGKINVGGSDVIDNNRRILAADGAENVPYITFAADTNTGLYRPGTDTLGFSTAGTERMRITSGGDVSIGSDHSGFSGWRVLNMRQISTGALINFEEDNGTRASTFAADGSALRYQTHIAGGYHRFETDGNSEAMRIIDNGNVGIGDANPVTSLDVRSSINTSADWWTNGKSTIFAYNTNASGDGILKLVGATGTQRIVYGLGANADKLIFSSRQAESDTSKTVVIDNNGDVGIGTASPARKFQVYIDNSNDLEYGYRNGLTIDRLSDENMDDASASVPADRYWPQGNLVLSDGNVFSSDSNGPGLSFYKHRDNSGNQYVQAFIGTRGVFGSNNTDLRFYVNSANAANLLPTSPQMLISGAYGYVGIGTTAPGAGLEVYGAGSNDKIAIKYSGTSGGHQSGIIFKDRRNQINAAVFNNLQNDAVGNAAANLELHTSTGGTLSPRIKIFHNGRVAIGDITPDAPLHVNGPAIIGSDNNNATTPIAALHVLDNSYGHWSTTLSKAQVALRVETYWNAANGQRAVGRYGGGIGFNHLGGHSLSHDENVHAWIGPRVVATPGHETSALVFATNNVTNDEDAGLLERASISPEGRFTFKQTSTNSSQIHNSVGYTDLYKFSFSMNMLGNQAYVIRTSGHGNGILRIMAQGSHWSSPYGLWRESYCMLDNSSTLSESNMHNQTSSQQGSWSFSRHSATEIDIVKAAGTYQGSMLTNIIIYSPRVVNVVGVY